MSEHVISQNEWDYLIDLLDYILSRICFID